MEDCDLFSTLFLPRALPQEACPGGDNRIASLLQEEWLAQRRLLGERSRSMIDEYLRLFKDIKMKSPGISVDEVIHKSLADVLLGSYWLFYLKAQNSVLLLHRVATEHAHMFAWQVQAKASENMSVVGSREQVVPQAGSRVEWSFVASAAFASLLVDLSGNAQKNAAPVSTKCGAGAQETRDVADARNVREWLLHAVYGKTITEPIAGVTKKVNDEIRWRNAERPWRRAALWFVVKSASHFVEHREKGQVWDYKTWIFAILTSALRKAYADGLASIPHSSLLEACRKLQVREEKMGHHFPGRPIPPLIKGECDELIRQITAGIQAGEDKLAKSKPSASLLRDKIRPKDDVHHQLVTGKDTVDAMIAERSSGDRFTPTPAKAKPPCPEVINPRLSRVEDVEKAIRILDAAHLAFQSDPQRILAALWRIEGAIARFWKDDRSTLQSLGAVGANALGEALLSLMSTYVAIGNQVFTSDPLGNGRLVLHALTLALLLDILACESHPLLKGHLLGISDGFLSHLYATTRAEREHLLSLEAYIRSRNERGRKPSSVDLGGSGDAFGVVFAQSDDACVKLRDDILKQCERGREEKKEEYLKLRDRYADLMARKSRLGCTCRHRGLSGCLKCDLEEEAGRITIEPYEKLLPTSPCGQWAVVFELCQPSVLRCQREAMFLLCERLCIAPKASLSERQGNCFKWIDDLRPWARNPRAFDSKVFLASTTKKFTQSHYGLPKRIVNAMLGNIIVEHGYNVAPGCIGKADMMGTLLASSQWPMCVKHLSKIHVKNEKYRVLETYLNGWGHDENMVIARQNEAHEGISSLSEFIAYGSMRAGCRLQFVRAAMALSSRSFSFEAQDVVSLMMAVSFQVGPASNDWRRETGGEMGKRDTVEGVCGQLGGLMDDCAGNYSKHNILLSAVILAKSVFELCEDADKEAPTKILREARRASEKWVVEIMGACNQCPDDELMQNLCSRLVDAALIGCMTFGDHDLLMGNAEDFKGWLFLRAALFDNLPPPEQKTPSWRRIHIFHVERIAEGMAHRLKQAPRTGLSMFLELYYAEARCDPDEVWAKQWSLASCASNPYCCWYERSFRCVALQIDALRGRFLVDGEPCSRLPKRITSHPLYCRTFGKSIFFVQPIGGGRFKTAMEIDGAYFSFRFDEETDIAPEIWEERNGVAARLIPHAAFQDDFPQKLLDDYSHWLCDQEIYFRPVTYSGDTARLKFRLGCSRPGADYVLHWSDKTVERVADKIKLLDVRSDTFGELHQSIFARLAPRDYVHAFYCGLEDTVLIQLPTAQGMRFEMKPPYARVSSLEYRGFLVSEDQNFGTLLGLQQGLLLENGADGERKKLIVPHGPVQVHKWGTESGRVSIDARPHRLRYPNVFAFAIDPNLRVLQPQKERIASLYLALLHGATSGLLPDPFTGRTGASSALQILDSGHATGNLLTSLGELGRLFYEEAKTIYDILRLSPARCYYPAHLQVMEDNDLGHQSEGGLCRIDAYAFVAENLLKDMERSASQIGKNGSAAALCGGETATQEIQLRTSILSKRAYLRYKRCAPDDMRLGPDKEKRLLGLGVLHGASRLGEGDKLNCADEVRLLSSVSAQGMTGVFYSRPRDMSVTKLLCESGEESLQGVSDREYNLEYPTEVARELQENAAWFGDLWLRLYDIARSIAEARQSEFGHLLCWLACEYPERIDSLFGLMHIAQRPAAFRGIIPPRHATYSSPGQREFMDAEIKQIASRYLRSRGRFEEFQNYERRKEEALGGVLRQCRGDYSRGSIQSHWRLEPDLDLISREDLVSLSGTLRVKMQGWQQATELYEFAEKVGRAEQGSFAGYPLCPTPSPFEPAIIDVAEVGAEGRFALRSERPPHPSFDPSSTIAPSRSSFCPSLANRPGEPRPRHNQGLGRTPQGDHDPAFAQIWTADETGDVTTEDDGEGSTTEDESKDDEADNTPKGLSLVGKLPIELQPGCEAPELAAAFLRDLQASWDSVPCDEAQGRLRGRPKKKDAQEKLKEMLQSERREAAKNMEKTWELICSTLEAGETRKLTGLWCAVTPFGVLQGFFMGKWKSHRTFEEVVRHYAVSMRRKQRASRCLGLLSDHQWARLDVELENYHSKNWSVEEYPNFLAFELDNDMCMREKQVEVAKEMLSDSDGNRNLQLDMGEGKTDAIVPPLLCESGRQKGKLSVLYVLPSLYPTNAANLQWKIGRLLGRRVVPMLCSRGGAPFSAAWAEEMVSMCEQARSQGDVLVLAPEHRLSLENKHIELARRSHNGGQLSQGGGESGEGHAGEDASASKALGLLLDWLSANSRQYLDEADEILSCKNQVIYTLDSQRVFDSGPLRWAIVSAVLRSVGHHAQKIEGQFGKDCIDILYRERCGTRCYYPGARLVESCHFDEAYTQLCRDVVDDIFSNDEFANVRPNLRPAEKESWARYVLGPDETADDLYQYIGGDGLASQQLASAYVFRGLLAHGVLGSSLSKRWRVDYGPHPTREFYQLAVPFRGKDVAKDLPEFSHPDIQLALTTMHYYHQGLSREQLMGVMGRLQNHINASTGKAIYATWVDALPTDMKAKLVGVSAFDGVNLDDMRQFEDVLYPCFAKSMQVVDFWLHTMIFPTQAKQFPFKVVATPWDLLGRGEREGGLITTGFSGTDDERFVLPLSTKQQNLPSLGHTNGLQIRRLLREENGAVFVLEDDARSPAERILEYLGKETGVNVVLDPGALILEDVEKQSPAAKTTCGINGVFARSWLNARSDAEAVVFYDDRDQVCVLKREGGDILPFAMTPYQEAGLPATCLLYLDDYHTRGADFRLPSTARAALTLGPRMTFAKVKQASMRMRQLGKGQSLTFVIPREVSLKLEKHMREGYAAAILAWSFENTTTRICDNLPYFIQQCRSHVHKSAIQQCAKTFHSPLEMLATKCVEREILELRELYERPRHCELLSDAVGRHFRSLEVLLNDSQFRIEETEIYANFHARMRAHIDKYAPRVRRHTNAIDEEQETEHEQELEEERHVERPGPASPLTPELTAGLMEFVRGNGLAGLYAARRALAKTSFWEPMGQPLASLRTPSYCTEDFVRTVEHTGSIEMDFYLKKIQWLVVDGRESNIVVVVSNYEAEALARLGLFNNATQRFRLQPFTPLVRLNQKVNIFPAQAESPILIHILAGTIYPGTDARKKDILAFLGLELDNPHADREGFVPPFFRADDEDECPFNENVLAVLKRFYCDARHLSSELPSSPIGKLIGAASTLAKS